MIKILKRKVSRTQIDVKDGNNGSSASAAAALSKSPSSQQAYVPVQYAYQRPALLGNVTHEELTSYQSHFERPIVTPK